MKTSREAFRVYPLPRLTVSLPAVLPVKALAPPLPLLLLSGSAHAVRRVTTRCRCALSEAIGHIPPG